MKFITIVACDENNLIGNENNKLPWDKIEMDMNWFKYHTKGKTIVMGRKTFESLNYKPLKGRKNIILTTHKIEINTIDKNTSVYFIDNIDKLNNICQENEIIFIIGGATIYNYFKDIVNEIYLTKIHSTFNGIKYFPHINLDKYEKYYSHDWEFSIPKITFEKYRLK